MEVKSCSFPVGFPPILKLSSFKTALSIAKSIVYSSNFGKSTFNVKLLYSLSQPISILIELNATSKI